MTMIERVARAAFAQTEKRGRLAGYSGAPMTWDTESEALHDDWRAVARAAIEAMREPTEAMCKAGNALTLVSGTMSGCWSDHHPEPEYAWGAMIDAALKE